MSKEVTSKIVHIDVSRNVHFHIDINTLKVDEERSNAYPVRSCQWETIVTTNSKKSAEVIVVLAIG